MISIPSIDSADAVTPGSATYQASTNMFSLDLGSILPMPASSSEHGTISKPVDYGMVSQEFIGPSTSYTTNLTSYQVPPFTVKGCKPTTNSGNCVKGGERAAGIALPAFKKASSTR
jgi:hypothetical protein